jgi:four helix bundle protein
MGDEYENYRGADGAINWGRYYTDKAGNDQSKKSKPLEELSIYRLADEFSDKVWELTAKWDFFEKKTLGDQFVRAADSIAANIAEGYGRYFFGEYRVFLYYARGSLYECKLWLEKTRKRSLINDDLYNEMRNTLDGLAVEINKVIKIVKGEQAKWKGRNW